MSTSLLPDLAIGEIVRLHDFFAAWFTATPDAAIDFADCERAFAPDFRMIGPDGRIATMPGIVAWLRDARGTRQDGFSIAIHETRCVWQQGDAVLMEYVEEQTQAGETTRRQSCALFMRAHAAPGGVVWRHLQETWLQAPHI